MSPEAKEFFKIKMTDDNKSEHEPPLMKMRENIYNLNDDYYSIRLETVEKILIMEKEVEHQLTICESYDERMEASEEVEMRRNEF